MPDQSLLDDLRLALDALLDAYDDAHPLIEKLVLDGALRAEAMHQLYRMNITQATLFPDLEGSEEFGGPILHPTQWSSDRDVSGKTVVVGHTPQTEILDLGYLIGLDTGVAQCGWLTALDVESGMLWQVNEAGSLRN